MRHLTCPHSRERLLFEQTDCRACGQRVIFRFDTLRFDLLEKARPCANRTLIGCNWAADEKAPYCASCRLTRTTPHHGQVRNILLWRRVEQAKRRLGYDMQRLSLPLRDGGQEV